MHQLGQKGVPMLLVDARFHLARAGAPTFARVNRARASVGKRSCPPPVESASRNSRTILRQPFRRRLPEPSSSFNVPLTLNDRDANVSTANVIGSREVLTQGGHVVPFH